MLTGGASTRRPESRRRGGARGGTACERTTAYKRAAEKSPGLLKHASLSRAMRSLRRTVGPGAPAFERRRRARSCGCARWKGFASSQPVACAFSGKSSRIGARPQMPTLAGEKHMSAARENPGMAVQADHARERLSGSPAMN